MAYIPDLAQLTQFNERLTTERVGILNLKPTYGPSDIIYDTFIEGDAFVTASTGEFEVNSGTQATSSIRIETQYRGQYQAGSQGEVGIGVRLPTENLPSGSQRFEWGIVDPENGLGFGVDATGPYVFVRSDGDTRVRPSEWSGNVTEEEFLDGLNNGIITEAHLVWYGYGDIKFYIYKDNGTNYVKELVHRINPTGSVSVKDPNQPLSFFAENGGETTNPTSIFFGGHQYSVYGKEFEFGRRQVASAVLDYELADTDDWQPLIAYRKKLRLNDLPNSVNVNLTSFTVATDRPVEVKLTLNGSVSGGTWQQPDGWPAEETATEVKVTSDGDPLSVGPLGEGRAITYGYVSSTRRQSASTFRENQTTLLGRTTQVILWVKRTESNRTPTVRIGEIEVTERW